MPPLSKDNEVKELEQIVEDSLEETQILEDLENANQAMKIEEEFKEFKKMKPEQATNNEILKEALINRSKSQDIESCLVYLKSKENEHFVEAMKELHYIKKHFNKVSFVVLGSVAVTFYLLGTQHDLVFPYITKLMSLLNMTRGA